MIARESIMVAGAFINSTHARVAVTELMRAGFAEGQINFVIRDDQNPLRAPVAGEPRTRGRNATLGVYVGGIVGLILGAIGVAAVPGVSAILVVGVLATALGIAAFGAASGGFLGAMTEFDSPQVDPYYEVIASRRRVVVTVASDGRDQEAADILNQAGAEYVESTRRTQYSAREVA